MDHAYEKDLFELLDLVNKEMDRNQNHRVVRDGVRVKQNCEWSQPKAGDKKIFFVPKDETY
jgi:hypothetical protein